QVGTPGDRRLDAVDIGGRIQRSSNSRHDGLRGVWYIAVTACGDERYARTPRDNSKLLSRKLEQMPSMLTHLVCAGDEVTMTTRSMVQPFQLGCSTEVIAFNLSWLVGEKPTMEETSTPAGQPSVCRL